jgi:hypothetical protein
MRSAETGIMAMYAASYAQPSAFTADTAARLARIRRVAWVVDAAFHIPGTRFRFGLNSLIGLTPIAGDAVLGMISLYIVQQAHAMGLPPAKLARMVGNIVLEVAAGSVPVVGDLFDVALKANLRNVRIVEDHLGGSAASATRR